jgi:trehalose 6-phosphate phosphatase
VRAILDAVPPEPGTKDAAQSPLLEALRADATHAAVLTDVDGTLAPIVERPELAAVPAEAGAALTELSERFALVGCISGRRAAEARRLVGVEGIAYAGNHGLELLLPGDEEPRLDPSLERPDAAESFAAQLDGEALATVGLRLEDKGPIQALHWRGAADEGAAEARARSIADEAARSGLHPHWGRKVLELRPLAEVGKDVAIRTLLSSQIALARTQFLPLSGKNCVRAVYAGDDTTDLDAFRGLREMRDRGELETTICVGVVSPEAPPELADQSDLTVDGPGGWLEILRSLAK